MSGHDPTWELDRADRNEDADPPPRGTPVDGEVRLFTVTAIRREMLGRFMLTAEYALLTCGLFTIWMLTHDEVGDWPLNATRTLPEPRAVQATWGADGWRVTAVEP